MGFHLGSERVKVLSHKVMCHVCFFVVVFFALLSETIISHKELYKVTLCIEMPLMRFICLGSELSSFINSSEPQLLITKDHVIQIITSYLSFFFPDTKAIEGARKASIH